MAFKRPNHPQGDVAAAWTDESAFNLELALKESRDWIEAATNEKFPSPDFIQSTKNGILLCKLLNQISPGIIPKINPGKTPAQERENIAFFLAGCKQLGLRDTQLFVTNDLYEGQRVRTVAITLYWLGRAARARPQYKGPQLKLTAFAKMNCNRCKKPITGDNYVVTLDQQWHVECAQCDRCHSPLSTDGYYQDKGQVVCPKCYEGGRGKGGEGSPATGTHKHPHDHSHGHDHGHDHDKECAVCGKPFDERTKPLKAKDGQNVCNDCICSGCNGIIEGPYASVGGKKYCRDCLCDGCNHPFQPTSKDYKIKDGKKLCQQCRCLGCDKYLEEGYIEQPKGSGKNYCLACANKNLAAAGQSREPSNSGITCSGCKRPIKGGEEYYTDRKGQPFCTQCKDRFVPIKETSTTSRGVCEKCGIPVTGDGIEALDKVWHPQCFTCSKCGTTFPDGNFVELNNKPYCRPCANQVAQQQQQQPSQRGTSPSSGNYIEGVTLCKGCEKPLQGEVAEISGNFWHKGCFKCNRCKKALIEGYYPFKDNPYCKDCWHIVANTERCNKCNKPIEKLGVKLQNMVFHEQCLTCEECHKNLRDKSGEIYVSGGKPYCAHCYKGAERIVQSPGSTTSQVVGPRRAGFTMDPVIGQKVWRCPQCQKALGTTPTVKFCSACGTAITY